MQKHSLSYDSNLVQFDEFGETTPKKSLLSRNSSEAENNTNLNSASKKIFHFLSADELNTIDSIDDILNVQL